MFEPDEGFVPDGKPKSMLGFVKKRLSGVGTEILLVALTAVLGAVFGVIEPAFSRVFLDRLLTGENPEWLYPFIILLAAVSLLWITVPCIQAVFNYRINGKLSVIGNCTFMWKLLRMPMDFFSQRMAGDLQQRQVMNGELSNQLIRTIVPLALNGVMMIFYMVVMLRYSLLLTFFGVAATVLNLIVSRFISKKRMNATRIEQRDSGRLNGITVAGMRMIENIKASGAENGYFEMWSGYQASANAQRIRFVKLTNYLGLIPSMISGLTNLLILAIGVYLTMRGSFTVGMLLAFQGLLNSFSAPAASLAVASQTVQEMRVNMEVVEDVLDYPSDLPASENPLSGDGQAEYSKLSGNVELRNVTFGYSKLAAPLIENFSMTLKPGSSVAFVGTSGCGKSTVSKLISGLYKPWSGEVLFDGKPISEIDRNVLTGSLSVVDQDITLFEDTIANNIKMWDTSIEDFEMILAARDAQIHDDILHRAGGYQYRITEGGKDFSGGQRQRLEIARVLAQDPTIIILDEATSALDAKTEHEVVKAIKNRGITCIVVAHRLSTIRDCDEIIVMDHGKVVERGTHDALYAKGGFYTKLVSND